MAYPNLDAALLKFSARCDRTRQDLHFCDLNSPQKGTRALRQNVHAASYVYLAAALEAFVKELLSALVDEINATSTSFSDLRLSLFSIAKGSDFLALQDVRGLKNWHRRIEILRHVAHLDPCLLSVEQLPVDGRTIRPEHFETIWMVFEFSGNSMPSPRHALALRDLANSRNSVAHGDEDAAVIAGQSAVSDTLMLLARTEELALHLYYTCEEYLDNCSYLR